MFPTVAQLTLDLDRAVFHCFRSVDAAMNEGHYLSNEEESGHRERERDKEEKMLYCISKYFKSNGLQQRTMNATSFISVASAEVGQTTACEPESPQKEGEVLNCENYEKEIQPEANEEIKDVKNDKKKKKTINKTWCHFYVEPTMLRSGFDVNKKIIGHGGANTKRIFEKTGLCDFWAHGLIHPYCGVFQVVSIACLMPQKVLLPRPFAKCPSQYLTVPA